VSPRIAQKEDTARKECYTRFAVGGVGPDFIRVIAMGVQAKGSRGRRLLRRGVCRKVKFYCPLPGSPSGRPLKEAPNRAVLANFWNGYERVFDYLIDVAILVILVRVFPTGVFLSHHVIDDINLDVTRDSCPWVACRFYSISPSPGGA
jgi:hypothetical protein